LEAIDCVGPTLASTIIILLLYANDIVHMARNPYGLNKKLRILKDFYSSTSMTVNTDKMKDMIIKSNKISYDTFTYDNNSLEEVPSYKYLRIDIHHNINWNYNIEKMINGGWKVYYGFEKNCKLANLCLWDKTNLLLETLVTPIILYGCEVWGFIISQES
jgi:hypothetical protein